MPHELIEIATEDGKCPARVYKPAGEGPWPGVLFFMDGIGIRPALFEVAERMSAGGYEVLLPDLFYRIGPYEAPDPTALFGDPAVRDAWFARARQAISAELLVRDTRAYLAHFAQARIGIVGYCMGGRMALTAGATYPDRFAAIAAFHPGNLVIEGLEAIRGKVYVAGATDDQTFPDSQKERLEQVLRAGGVDHVVETYPARHGWVPSDTPVHDPAAAERHWASLFELFRTTLAA